MEVQFLRSVLVLRVKAKCGVVLSTSVTSPSDVREMSVNIGLSGTVGTASIAASAVSRAVATPAGSVAASIALSPSALAVFSASQFAAV